jgi:hypothetical protein
MAEDIARRAAELALEVAFPEFAAHGYAIGATLARFGGRLDESAALAEKLGTLELAPNSGVAYLARSVEFCARVARGEGRHEAPPTIQSPDPVAWAGWVFNIESLVLADRIDEALELLDAAGPPSLGAALEGMLLGWPRALALVLCGRADEATSVLEHALQASEAVRAGPASIGTRALLAEVAYRTGDRRRAEDLLDEVGDDPPGGVAGALVSRARAVLGDEGALDALRVQATKLAAPALLQGIEGTISTPKLL